MGIAREAGSNKAKEFAVRSSCPKAVCCALAGYPSWEQLSQTHAGCGVGSWGTQWKESWSLSKKLLDSSRFIMPSYGHPLAVMHVVCVCVVSWFPSFFFLAFCTCPVSHLVAEEVCPWMDWWPHCSISELRFFLTSHHRFTLPPVSDPSWLARGKGDRWEEEGSIIMFLELYL